MLHQNRHIKSRQKICRWLCAALGLLLLAGCGADASWVPSVPAGMDRLPQSDGPARLPETGAATGTLPVCFLSRGPKYIGEHIGSKARAGSRYSRQARTAGTPTGSAQGESAVFAADGWVFRFELQEQQIVLDAENREDGRRLRLEDRLACGAGTAELFFDGLYGDRLFFSVVTSSAESGGLLFKRYTIDLAPLCSCDPQDRV